MSTRRVRLAPDLLTLRIWQAGLAGVPLTLLVPSSTGGPGGPDRPPCGGRTEGGWTDLDQDVARLIYGVLIEGSRCGRCAAPFRPGVRARPYVEASAVPRIVVTARCGRRWWHRHVAEVTYRSGGLRFGPVQPG